MITSCVNVLRQLAKTMNEVMGYDQGLQHAAVDISKDIASLMVSLDDRKVYCLTRGRMLDEDQLVNNVTAVGLEALITGATNPLNEYNGTFQQYQERRRMPPIDIDDMSPPLTPPADHYMFTGSHSIPDSDGTASEAPAGDHRTTDEMDGGFTGELVKILDELGQGLVEPMLGLVGEDDVTLDFEDAFDDEIAENGDDECFEESDAEPEAEIEEIGESDMDFAYNG